MFKGISFGCLLDKEALAGERSIRAVFGLVVTFLASLVVESFFVLEVVFLAAALVAVERRLAVRLVVLCFLVVRLRRALAASGFVLMLLTIAR